MQNILIIGASRGLGFSLVQGLLRQSDQIFTVSRSKLDLTKLEKIQKLETSKIVEIQCDLSETKNLPTIYKIIDKNMLDLIIYNAGIWKNQNFEDETDEMLENIITLNLTSAILILKNLLPNLKKSKKANVILIGSTADLPNSGSFGVSYVASKFGLSYPQFKGRFTKE
jgi:short-subunit dehydrogenase